jgi:hypothetical protein
MPSPSELNRNRFLENFSVAAFQTGDNGDGAEGFVARQVFPILPVDEDAGKYHEVNMDDMMRDEANERAPGTRVPHADFKVTDASYITKQYTVGQKLPEETDRKSYPALPVLEAATKVANERALISQEVRFKGAAFNTGIWTRNIAGAATTVADTSYVYWNRTGSKPIDDVSNERLIMKPAGFREPNTVVLGAIAAERVLLNEQIINRLNNGQTPGGPAEASLADLAKLWKVKRVIVAKAVYNSAKEKATPSKNYILDPKSAWVGYVAPKMSKFTTTAGTTITYRGLSGNDEGIRVYRRWSDDYRSWLIEVFHDDCFKVVDADLGVFLPGIVE